MKKHKKEILKKAMAVMLCILSLFTGMPLPIYAQVSTLPTQKDTATDFNSFISSCSDIERIQLMQALGGLDQKLKDSDFDTLQGLPALSSFAKNKNEASATKPLKPETFNEVPPATVKEAIDRKILDYNVISRERICEMLVKKRYGTNAFHDEDKISYHEDIVKWVAEKKDIDKDLRNTLSTYCLERKISEKYFAEIWDSLTEEQRKELLSKIEFETNSTFYDKAAIVGMSRAAAITALRAYP